MMFILYLKLVSYERFRGLAQEHLARYWGSWLNYSLSSGVPAGIQPAVSSLGLLSSPARAYHLYVLTSALIPYIVPFFPLHRGLVPEFLGRDQNLIHLYPWRTCSISHVLWITSGLPVVILVPPIEYPIRCWCVSVVFTSGCLGNVKTKSVHMCSLQTSDRFRPSRLTPHGWHPLFRVADGLFS